MNPIEAQAATVLFTMVNIAILWKLFFVWNHYRLAALRQDLFEVRDSLFDIAVKNPFLFSHPSYLRLRHSINFSIQFAHKFTTTRLMVTLYIRRVRTIPVDNWPDTLTGLPNEITQELVRIHKMMGFRMGCHLLHISMPVAWWLLDRAKSISTQAATRAKQEIAEKVEMLEFQAAEEYAIEKSEYAHAAAVGN